MLSGKVLLPNRETITAETLRLRVGEGKKWNNELSVFCIQKPKFLSVADRLGMLGL